ncbi:MAG: DUF1893 domain-containing protein [Muribaculaceae bacterium]|nr:DUF1893 domain-containing protein [Muribaculaceae bacterium]
MDNNLERAVAMLHESGCSCVIYNNDAFTSFYQRGVKDLYMLLKREPCMLSGALVADKVVGKGAAALMIAGGIRGVYADIISEPAMSLFAGSDVKVSYGICVPNIINRMGTGICPVEKLCAECTSAEECIPLIAGFISGLTA